MAENSRIIAVAILAPEHPQRLGPMALEQELAHGHTVLTSAISRLRQITEADAFTLMHPDGATPALPDDLTSEVEDRPFTLQPATLHTDMLYSELMLARKWASTSWRGGIGGTCIHDELRFFQDLLDLAERQRADALYIIGAHWPFHDPNLANEMMTYYRELTKAPPVTFSQAPPGAAGILLQVSLVKDLMTNHGWIGRMFEYMPKHPQPDPIGKDFCISIPHALRNAQVRLIADSHRWTTLLQQAAQQLPPGADTTALALRTSDLRKAQPWEMPQRCHIELTVKRQATGPITPQHHIEFEREDMSLELAQSIIDQLSVIPDICLTFGGLGDPLLHPQWKEIISYAKSKNIFGIHLKTDLIHADQELESLMTLGLDVLSININADTAAVYQKVMGLNAFENVRDSTTRLLELRNQHKDALRPYIIPTLVKVKDNLKDMESFFDRSVHCTLHGVIERFDTGNGLIEDQSPISMQAADRPGMRPIELPLCIHSDGQVVFKTSDWLAKRALGDFNHESLSQIWPRVMEQWQTEHLGLNLESLDALRDLVKGSSS